jgi:hypothetical protein
LTVRLPLRHGGTDFRRLEVDELTERVGGEPGDPERGLVVLDAGPVVLLVVLQVVGVALGGCH